MLKEVWISRINFVRFKNESIQQIVGSRNLTFSIGERITLVPNARNHRSVIGVVTNIREIKRQGRAVMLTIDSLKRASLNPPISS